MAELNKILLIGRLTKDPDLRYTQSGGAVATLRMAVNHTYRVKDEKKEEVLYIDCTVWGKSAENAKQYLTKGREVFVEGRLQMNDWTDKQGQKRRDFRVNADRFNFIGSSGGGGRQGASREAEAEAEVGGAPPETFDGGDAPPRQDASQQQADDLPF